MNAQLKHDGEMILDHVGQLSSLRSDLANVTRSQQAQGAEIGMIRDKVSLIDKQVMVIQVKITAYVTAAVLVGNVLFQVGLRLFT